ncbi:aspartic protease [Devosia pacifica]|uniref:Aspartic protease n=1 Tax=Devosia pacifica TaxID=1335967 RepID=A0A918VV99_9HYPH|nr:TIGR02281 family clan AA aspartic protease [Devosia pacifica]GHA29055.1 aspartic protease [Devosia pacifica]
MLFIGIALIIAIGLVLLISADAGSLIGLGQAQTGQLMFLLILLVILAGGGFMRRRPLGELLNGIVMWVAIFGVVIVGYSYRAEIEDVAARVMGELNPGAATVNESTGTVTFRRGIGGHFELNTTINGHTTPMIFDTGASAVVLTLEDAEAAGIDTSRLRFTVPVSTANGMGMAARVDLGTVKVGNIVRNDVRAFVAEENALETSLLGMTFLETLSRYSVSRNALELTD